MSMQTIRSAITVVWPEVQKSLAIHNAKREEVKADPSRFSPAARKRATRGWSRVVSEETVWAIAKADLLARPEQAALVEAAKKWAKTWDDTPSSEMEPEDKVLYEAVKELLYAEADTLEVVA